MPISATHNAHYHISTPTEPSKDTVSSKKHADRLPSAHSHQQPQARFPLLQHTLALSPYVNVGDRDMLEGPPALCADLAALCERHLREMEQFLVDNSVTTGNEVGYSSCENIQGAFLANLADEPQDGNSTPLAELLCDEPLVTSAIHTQVATWTSELEALTTSLHEFLACNAPAPPAPLAVVASRYSIVIECHRSLQRQCWRIEELKHLLGSLSTLVTASNVNSSSQSDKWKSLVALHEQLGWIYMPIDAATDHEPQ